VPLKNRHGKAQETLIILSFTHAWIRSDGPKKGINGYS
jgi:hypothetical protein